MFDPSRVYPGAHAWQAIKEEQAVQEKGHLVQDPAE